MEKMHNLFSEDKARQEAEVMTKTLNEQFPEQQGSFEPNQYEDVDKNMAEKQVQMIKDLSMLDIPVYLAGGYASDFLISNIDGEVANPHTDIDMITKNENTDVLETKVKEMGYKVKKKSLHSSQGVGKLYITGTKDIQADFALADIDKNTQEPYISTSRNGKPIRIFFSRDLFGHDATVLGDTIVKIISPRALIQSLLFYSQVWGETPREKDVVRAELLREKYFPDETLDSPLFKVRVEEVDETDK